MSARNLYISDSLGLPRDAQTSTLVIFGGRGMGKTNLIAVIAEELSFAHLRFCLIDPVGVSWGLRYSEDGQGPGIPVLILGGRHGDIPIEPTGGAVVADLVVDENVDVLIDISSRSDGKSWSRGQRIHFVTDYFTRLYERQGEKRRPILQIVDEAARFIPQMVRAGDKDGAFCSSAIETVVEEGRNVGIGVMLISQRSARMAKAVTELADAMIAFRTVGPNSVGAIVDWFGEHLPKERWAPMVEQLRKLPRGTALVVSPGWLEYEGAVAMRLRRTFDSSATPKVGRQRRTSGQGAKPDLSRYVERMASTIEKAKAEDPRELQKQIRELKARIEQAESKTYQNAVAQPLEQDALKREFERGANSIKKELRTELRLCEKTWGMIKPATLSALSDLATAVAQTILRVEQIQLRAFPDIDTISEDVKQEDSYPPRLPARPVPPARPKIQSTVAAESPNGATTDIGNSGLRRMLIALAQRPQGLTPSQLGIRACVATKGGTFRTYLSRARTNGWISTEKAGLIYLTHDGQLALGSFTPLPEGKELLMYWIGELGNSGAARMLKALSESGRPLTAEELGEAANIEMAGGSFRTYLSRLRTLELITGPTSALRISDELRDAA